MTTPNSMIWRAAALALVLVIAVSACGGDDAATTTIDPSEDVIFGSGTWPDTLPSDFPIPAEAVIGSTLVVRSSGTTEVIMRIPVEVAAAVTYFEQNLDAHGFDISSSESQADGKWEMEIERDDLSGTITFSAATTQVSEIVMRFTTG